MSFAAVPVSRSWWVFLLFGLVAVLFGVSTLIWPGGTVLALVLVFGAFSLADGLVSLISAFSREHALPRWLLALYALISIAFGVLAIAQPAQMAAALLWLLAVWLVIAGVARIVFAVQVRKHIRGEWLLVLSGVLSILLGVLFFVFPAAGLLTMALWFGIGAIVYGVLQLVVAFRLRGHRLAA
ncbi:HdeD family acid-resistance protein [Pseudoxanthomonas winnipegensis]|jgi:uncharacterized membrane protein HdeD (DUF308 family)|uniref:HdeD family acid-resistance protein n=1 Tax=Pseudoxanthomonas winnipegensis TaxID=2480810 RepID=A0A4Q8LB36_9GAMM|nr:DUF308 domain-containing protein [Pseudoxanthomonas winnipegensis]PZP60605.1 MAG: hypothetical protein DI597_11785 [Pseudoxanthomonas spadix]TAA25680.1 HdeD family acid-resistance protein [Pseudoxanthomonas winnipegensis]